MSENLLKRYKHNSWMFILTYILMGVMGGIVFDTLVTFLEAAAPASATSFASFMGIATFAASFIMLLAPKIGYKKLMMFGPVASVAALILVNYTSNSLLINVATFALITGVSMYDVVLPPYLATYTTPENRASLFSKALYTNVAGMVVGTWVGGPMICWRLGAKLGLPYADAKALTGAVDNMTAIQHAGYIAAHQDVLLMFAVVAGLSLLPILFVKEEKEDYKAVEVKEKQKFDWSVFANKYVVIFLVYTALIRFGASLICPYFSLFLGKLGIDRSTVSQLVTYQYAAMVIFMILAPYIIKKIGQVMTLGWLSVASIPFMMIIANGHAFGSGMIVAVGAALFLRSGLMNATNPVMNSLPMEFVSKELRPAYNSAIFVVCGLMQIAAGQFAKGFLFKTAAGYSTAYYITAVLYIIASALLLVVFTKKYNRSNESTTEEQEAA